MSATRHHLFRRASTALLKHNQLSPEQRYLLATIFAELNEPARAEKFFKESVTMSPSEIAWREKYAEFLASQGKTDDAIRQLRICQEISSKPERHHERLEALRQERQK